MQRTGACRAVIQLAGIGFGVRNQLLEGLHWQLVGDRNGLRRIDDQRDRHEAFERIPIEVFVEKRIGRMKAGIRREQRVAIGP